LIAALVIYINVVIVVGVVMVMMGGSDGGEGDGGGFENPIKKAKSSSLDWFSFY